MGHHKVAFLLVYALLVILRIAHYLWRVRRPRVKRFLLRPCRTAEGHPVLAVVLCDAAACPEDADGDCSTGVDNVDPNDGKNIGKDDRQDDDDGKYGAVDEGHRRVVARPLCANVNRISMARCDGDSYSSPVDLPRAIHDRLLDLLKINADGDAADARMPRPFDCGSLVAALTGIRREDLIDLVYRYKFCEVAQQDLKPGDVILLTASILPPPPLPNTLGYYASSKWPLSDHHFALVIDNRCPCLFISKYGPRGAIVVSSYRQLLACYDASNGKTYRVGI
jgi:hypothetical protein